MDLSAREIIEHSEPATALRAADIPEGSAKIAAHAFKAVRNYDEAVGGEYLTFSGSTSTANYNIKPELHIARAVFPDSEDPQEDLGIVTVENDVTYAVVAPEKGNINVSQSFTIYDDEGVIIYQVSSNAETSDAPSYSLVRHSSDNDSRMSRQHVADTTREVMEADGSLTISDEEWLKIMELSDSTEIEDIEQLKLRVDLRMASLSFDSLYRIIRAQSM